MKSPKKAKSSKQKESLQQDLHPQPTHYKGVALLLCYGGMICLIYYERKKEIY